MFHCCPICSLTWFIVCLLIYCLFIIYCYCLVSPCIFCISLPWFHHLCLVVIPAVNCSHLCFPAFLYKQPLSVFGCCLVMVVSSLLPCLFHLGCSVQCTMYLHPGLWLCFSFVTFIKDRFLFATSEVVWVCHFPVTVICFALLLRTKGRQRYYGRKWAPRAARSTRPARTKLPFCPTAWWCFYRLQSTWVSHFTTLLLNISKH